MRPFILGLAGGIASGKSTVARLLREGGAVVLDADALAHDALRAPEVKDRVVAAFGEAILGEEGEIDRRRLAAHVFGNDDRLRLLEEAIHPVVLDGIQRVIGGMGSGNGSRTLLVIDAPLLFETGLDTLADAVLFVDAPLPLREARVQRDRKWEPGELTRREAHQLPIAEKRRRATWVIENDGTLRELADRVEEVLTRLRAEIQRTPPTDAEGGSGRLSSSSP